MPSISPSSSKPSQNPSTAPTTSRPSLTPSNSPTTPRPSLTPSKFRPIVPAISAGGHHTCAIISGGAVQCWGDNEYGEIGDGTSGTNRLTPKQVSGLTSGVQLIAAGDSHTCALLTGAVKCWGSNYYGEVGDGTSFNNVLTPSQVSGLTTGVQSIAAGYLHTCALLTTGAVQCWGFNNNGQIGDGTTNDRITPTQVSGLTSGVQWISVGSSHTCAILATGAVQCWGDNNDGQLGDGTTNERLTPTQVSSLTSGVQSIACAYEHTCALLTTGAVQCWGSNVFGQIGDNTTITRLTPTQVLGLASGVQSIGVGSSHTCAILSGGAAKCWGYNGDGEVGDGTSGTNSLTPTQVLGLTSGVQSISAGASHTCALLTTDVIKCWGDNYYGEIGDGTRTNRLTPVTV